MKLYGVKASRALRSIWAAEETGVEYEHIPTHFFTGTKTPDYLAVQHAVSPRRPAPPHSAR